MKKRRTRAQIAATKKLVAFNKKRRGKKTVRKARKKRRTAKQIAATRKLVALNKRRGRNPCRKKVVRRNPRRKKAVSKKSHLWLVFRCRGKSVYFLSISAKQYSAGIAAQWRSDKSKTILLKTKKAGEQLARTLTKKQGMANWQIGVAPDNTTTAQIRAACNPKA